MTDEICAMAPYADPKVYPYESGDVLVLGPEIFVSADRTVICWRGDNYYHPAYDFFHGDHYLDHQLLD